MNIDRILKTYFDESGEDAEFVNYDLKLGFTATMVHDDIVVISISHDKKTVNVHNEEFGERPSSIEAIETNLAIFKHVKVL